MVITGVPDIFPTESKSSSCEMICFNFLIFFYLFAVWVGYANNVRGPTQEMNNAAEKQMDKYGAQLDDHGTEPGQSAPP